MTLPVRAAAGVAGADGGRPVSLPAPAQRRRRSLSARSRRVFLEGLEAGFSVTHAAELAGVYRRRFYEARDADPAFAEAWADAWHQGTDVYIDEARRRAVEGWDEPVYQKGELVGHVRRYSDALLMLKLKQRDPSFRENHRVEVTGEGGGPVELTHDPGRASRLFEKLVGAGLLAQVPEQLTDGLQRLDEGPLLALPPGEEASS